MINSGDWCVLAVHYGLCVYTPVQVKVLIQTLLSTPSSIGWFKMAATWHSRTSPRAKCERLLTFCSSKYIYLNLTSSVCSGMNWWRSAGVWNPLTDQPSSWSLRSSISSSSPPMTQLHITANRWGRPVSSSDWFHWRIKLTHHVSSQLYRNIFDCTEEEVGGGGDMLKGGDDDEERRQTGNQPGPPQLLLRDRSPPSVWLLPLFIPVRAPWGWHQASGKEHLPVVLIISSNQNVFRCQIQTTILTFRVKKVATKLCSKTHLVQKVFKKTQ